MRIKIGDEIHNPEGRPIAIFLTEADRDQIRDLPRGNRVYCQFPEDMDVEVAKEFMLGFREACEAELDSTDNQE